MIILNLINRIYTSKACGNAEVTGLQRNINAILRETSNLEATTENREMVASRITETLKSFNATNLNYLEKDKYDEIYIQASNNIKALRGETKETSKENNEVKSEGNGKVTVTTNTDEKMIEKRRFDMTYNRFMEADPDDEIEFTFCFKAFWGKWLMLINRLDLFKSVMTATDEEQYELAKDLYNKLRPEYLKKRERANGDIFEIYVDENDIKEANQKAAFYVAASENYCVPFPPEYYEN